MANSNDARWRIEPGRDGEARAKRLLALVMNGLQRERQPRGR
jgi:hypothetical protein